MRLLISWIVAVIALSISGTGIASVPQDEEKLQRKPIDPRHVRQAVRETIYRILGNAPMRDIYEISYDGIVVMYETSGIQNRREFEIVIRPFGERVVATQLDKERVIDEREIQEKDLPTTVERAAKKHFGETELTRFAVVTYRAVPILYSVESEVEQILIAVNGDRERVIKKPPPSEDEQAEEGEMPPDGEEPDGETPGGTRLSLAFRSGDGT